MSQPTFAEKWHAAQAGSRLAIGIAPRINRLPAPIARYDDPFLPFSRAIIHATAASACAYVFDLASFLSLGAAGAVALERSIALVPRHLVAILHAPFASADFADAAFNSPLMVDAVTLAVGSVVSAYLGDPRRAVFVDAKAALGGENIGFYDADGFTFGGVRVLWATEAIIYASGRDDFAEKAAAAAEIFRQESLKETP